MEDFTSNKSGFDIVDFGVFFWPPKQYLAEGIQQPNWIMGHSWLWLLQMSCNYVKVLIVETWKDKKGG